MKIRASIALIALCSAALFIESLSLAQPAPGKVVGPVKQLSPTPATPAGPVNGAAAINGANGAVQADPSPTARPPNLALVALTSDPQCNVKVTIRNEGGLIPSNQPAIQYTVTRANPATQEAPQSIPAAQLSSPGSQVTVIYPGLKTTNTPTSFTAHVASNVRDHRTGAPGTTVTHNLICNKTPPDLSMAVAYEEDCSKTVMIRNSGGELPAFQNGVSLMVERKLDGWPFHALSTNSALPSGAKLELRDGVRSYESTSYSAKGAQGTPLNLSNNDAIPARCRGPKPNYKVNLANVDVNKQTCVPFATVINEGAPLPGGAELDIDFVRDGESSVYINRGHFDSGMGMKTGDKRDVNARNALTAAPVNFKITIQSPAGPVGPKVISLNCPTAH